MNRTLRSKSRSFASLFWRPAALISSLFTFGCVSLTPYAEILRTLPQNDRLTIDGRTVHVEQRGKGEPLLLLHGFGESTYLWRQVVPALSAHYRTIAIDLNGFGYTERPKERAAYSRDGQLRLILGVLDALKIKSVHVAGHSYGGALTLSLAALHPERVRSLILMDSAAVTYPDETKSRLAKSRTLSRLGIGIALRPSAIRRVLRKAYFDDSLATPETADAYFSRLAIEGVLDAYAGLSLPTPPAGPPIDLAKIHRPSLWIWGADDRTVKIEAGRAAAAKMAESTFAAIKHCGHSPMEERPDEVVRLILPFLKSHPGAR
ncbi:MAG TPA: alpha/beta hydrolase [Thermoanaerobaculia bacterium]|nr:alpha/beta hydrolase [Thermoanaerobaculia bacterium]